LQAGGEVVPDEEGKPVEYRSCPNLWMKSPIMEFFKMRRYLEQHPHTAPAFHERSPRYVAFEEYYSSVLADFQDAKAAGGAAPEPEGVV
jgi:hypothetical protein